MSLATRCTSCGTIFRVVQEQLKVSEGWVRCGRCQEVFSALEGLFDLEREAPPQRVENKASATEAVADEVAEFVNSRPGEPTDFDPFAGGAAAHASASASASEGDLDDLPSTHEHDAIESRFLTHAEPAFRSGDSVEPADEFFSARFSDDAADDRPAADPAPADGVRAPVGKSLLDRWRAHRDTQHSALASSMLDPSLGPSTQEQPLAEAATPGYLSIDAPPATVWQRPATRNALSAAAVLLVFGLLGQVAYQFRDVFATQWPQSRGALLSLCDWTGCKIEPLRRLAAVTVEDSGLTQVQGAEAYRLSVTLHNRSAFEVAVPSIDLSLTDGAGALVARRALAPADFAGAPAATTPGGALTLGPGGEAQMQALLASRGARITGYTVELFYP